MLSETVDLQELYRYLRIFKNWNPVTMINNLNLTPYRHKKTPVNQSVTNNTAAQIHTPSQSLKTIDTMAVKGPYVNINKRKVDKSEIKPINDMAQKADERIEQPIVDSGHAVHLHRRSPQGKRESMPEPDTFSRRDSERHVTNEPREAAPAGRTDSSDVIHGNPFEPENSIQADLSLSSYSILPWDQLLDQSIEKTGLFGLKRDLDIFQLTNPDMDLSTIINAIDHSLALYRSITLIEVISDFADVIELMDPVNADKYRESISGLLRYYEQINSQRRIKRGISNTLAEGIIHTLDLIRQLPLDSGLRSFFSGYNQRKEEVIRQLVTPDDQAEVKLLLAAKEDDINRLNQSIQTRLNGVQGNQDFVAAGKDCFDMNFIFYHIDEKMEPSILIKPESTTDYIAAIETIQHEVLNIIDATLPYERFPFSAIAAFSIIRNNPYIIKAAYGRGIGYGCCVGMVYTAIVAGQGTTFTLNLNRDTFNPAHGQDLVLNTVNLVQLLDAYYNNNQLGHRPGTDYSIGLLNYYGFKFNSYYFRSSMDKFGSIESRIYDDSKLAQMEINQLGSYLIDLLINKKNSNPSLSTVSCQGIIEDPKHVIRVAAEYHDNQAHLVYEDLLQGRISVSDPQRDTLLKKWQTNVVPFLSDSIRSITGGAIINLYYQPDDFIDQMGSLIILPESCLTIKDIVTTADYKTLNQIEQRKTQEFLNTYLSVINRETTRDFLATPVIPDYQPADDQVSINDHIIYQAKEVLDEIRSKVATDGGVASANTAYLARHVTKVFTAVQSIHEILEANPRLKVLPEAAVPDPLQPLTSHQSEQQIRLDSAWQRVGADSSAIDDVTRLLAMVQDADLSTVLGQVPDYLKSAASAINSGEVPLTKAKKSEQAIADARIQGRLTGDGVADWLTALEEERPEEAGAGPSGYRADVQDVLDMLDVQKFEVPDEADQEPIQPPKKKKKKAEAQKRCRRSLDANCERSPRPLANRPVEDAFTEEALHSLWDIKTLLEQLGMKGDPLLPALLYTFSRQAASIPVSGKVNGNHVGERENNLGEKPVGKTRGELISEGIHKPLAETDIDNVRGLFEGRHPDQETAVHDISDDGLDFPDVPELEPGNELGLPDVPEYEPGRTGIRQRERIAIAVKTDEQGNPVRNSLNQRPGRRPELPQEPEKQGPVIPRNLQEIELPEVEVPKDGDIPRTLKVILDEDPDLIRDLQDAWYDPDYPMGLPPDHEPGNLLDGLNGPDENQPGNPIDNKNIPLGNNDETRSSQTISRSSFCARAGGMVGGQLGGFGGGQIGKQIDEYLKESGDEGTNTIHKNTTIPKITPTLFSAPPVKADSTVGSGATTTDNNRFSASQTASANASTPDLNTAQTTWITVTDTVTTWGSTLVNDPSEIKQYPNRQERAGDQQSWRVQKTGQRSEGSKTGQRLGGHMGGAIGGAVGSKIGEELCKKIEEAAKKAAKEVAKKAAKEAAKQAAKKLGNSGKKLLDKAVKELLKKGLKEALKAALKLAKAAIAKILGAAGLTFAAVFGGIAAFFSWFGILFSREYDRVDMEEALRLFPSIFKKTNEGSLHIQERVNSTSSTRQPSPLQTSSNSTLTTVTNTGSTEVPTTEPTIPPDLTGGQTTLITGTDIFTTGGSTLATVPTSTKLDSTGQTGSTFPDTFDTTTINPDTSDQTITEVITETEWLTTDQTLQASSAARTGATLTGTPDLTSDQTITEVITETEWLATDQTLQASSAARTGATLTGTPDLTSDQTITEVITETEWLTTDQTLQASSAARTGATLTGTPDLTSARTTQQTAGTLPDSFAATTTNPDTSDQTITDVITEIETEWLTITQTTLKTGNTIVTGQTDSTSPAISTTIDVNATAKSDCDEQIQADKKKLAKKERRLEKLIARQKARLHTKANQAENLRKRLEIEAKNCPMGIPDTMQASETQKPDPDNTCDNKQIRRLERQLHHQQNKMEHLGIRQHIKVEQEKLSITEMKEQIHQKEKVCISKSAALPTSTASSELELPDLALSASPDNVNENTPEAHARHPHPIRHPGNKPGHRHYKTQPNRGRQAITEQAPANLPESNHINSEEPPAISSAGSSLHSGSLNRMGSWLNNALSDLGAWTKTAFSGSPTDSDSPPPSFARQSIPNINPQDPEQPATPLLPTAPDLMQNASNALSLANLVAHKMTGNSLIDTDREPLSIHQQPVVQLVTRALSELPRHLEVAGPISPELADQFIQQVINSTNLGVQHTQVDSLFTIDDDGNSLIKNAYRQEFDRCLAEAQKAVIGKTPFRRSLPVGNLTETLMDLLIKQGNYREARQYFLEMPPKMQNVVLDDLKSIPDVYGQDKSQGMALTLPGDRDLAWQLVTYYGEIKYRFHEEIHTITRIVNRMQNSGLEGDIADCLIWNILDDLPVKTRLYQYAVNEGYRSTSLINPLPIHRYDSTRVKQMIERFCSGMQGRQTGQRDFESHRHHSGSGIS